jgi:hypothetical protein
MKTLKICVAITQNAKTKQERYLKTVAALENRISYKQD